MKQSFTTEIGDKTMESIFKNDTVGDLIVMLSDTQQRKEALLEEIESCIDCIEDINRELLKRG
ncbi:hypothetical protein LCGC14_2782480 [marine sediment metagenome]|uniref:Uncharacterized protein n=1 Tax=marine sediment metagenome TaxID=412755 RepID=A0A0F9BJG2_9ZZZZ